MAKQTFTTGQVLTAAQMTSLQETAMGGGPATAKTASYVLVAADAGTTVAMNAAGATTITVNTGLFAAGDTVFIQNLGAGACTVTAGTATVATAGSLILPQNDAGILYFTATGAAIFYDYIQAGAVSPLTTKGDLYTFSTSDARLGVGANNTILTADSAEATGLKWVAAAGGGANWSLLNSGGTTLNGVSTVTVSGISGKDKIVILVKGGSTSSSGGNYAVRFNADTGSNYIYSTGLNQYAASYSSGDHYLSESLTGTSFSIGDGGNSASHTGGFFLQANGCNASGVKMMQFTFAGTGTNTFSNYGGGIYTGSSTISSVEVFSNTGNWDAGTVYVYTSA